MGKILKNIVRQIHLWLGLGTGLIVFIISITGCLYVFEKEIREFTQKDYLYVAPADKGFVGLGSILQNFEKIGTKEKITLIRITNSKPNAAVSISTSKKNVYYFNPYDGRMINKTKTDWLVTVQNIHTSLLLGESGKFIIRWSVVIFIIMLITGWILWFPNQMRLLKKALTIKWDASFKRLNFDFHKVLGFYSSTILIVVALSGLYFGFKEVKSAVGFLLGEKLTHEKTALSNIALNVKSVSSLYDGLYKTAVLKFPGAQSTSLSLRNGEIRLRMLFPYKWARNQNTFYYNAVTGQLLRYKLYKEFNSADLYEATNYDLHTGQLFGIFGKILACIVSLISASLPVTGFCIWLGRRKKALKMVLENQLI